MILHMKFLKRLDKVTEKKITYMWRREHTSKFPYGIYWRTLKNLKNQNFEKNRKKLLEISSFYTCVPKTTIIWSTVPAIQSETNLFCDFGLFFAFYLPPSPPPYPNNPENQIFEKMKKAFGDAIILNLCNKKLDKMMYAYSDIECNRHNFCHFRTFFALLPHYWPQKLKLGKNSKNN